MLRQAVAGLLAAQGWDVESEGSIVVGRKDDSEIVVAFLRRGDASAYLGDREESAASLGAVLLEDLSPEEVGSLEAAGVACFSREEAENTVLAGWLGRPRAEGSAFLRFLAGD